jgi:hypothetical protein
MKVLKLVLFNISFTSIACGMEKFLKPERNRPKTNENIIFALASMHKAPLNKTLSVLRAGKKIEEKNNETPPTSEKIRFSQKILFF